ncbi:MAG: M20 family metallo-hydrolase [Deltaproteobacteria bacterium]|nr:M20 family metallo-hydrolase [Deltaproteobacteria bacterium]
MVDKVILKKICKKIDSYRDDMIELQRLLTAIPAIGPENKGDGEYEKARVLINYMRSRGFKDIVEYNAPDDRVSSGIRPNIILTLPGRNPKKTVWILTHTDIVPPGEMNLWDHDPYKAIVRDGKIFGRGTEDNQQELVASIFATKAFIDEKITPASTIGLAFVADEETSSAKGLAYLLETKRNLFKMDDIIVVPDFGNPEGSMIEIAEKSILWLRFRTLGAQCHGSTPEKGKNAFLAASHLVVRLNDLYDVFNASEAMYQPPVSTFAPTKKEANVPNINTIPGEDVFYLDCRVLPSYDLEVILSEINKMTKEIEKQFDVSILYEKIQEVTAPEPTPYNANVVSALTVAVKDIYGVSPVPIGVGGGTVAAHLRKEGYPAAAWSKIDKTMHQPNEYSVIDNMVGNAKVYAHLFLQ